MVKCWVRSLNESLELVSVSGVEFVVIKCWVLKYVRMEFVVIKCRMVKCVGVEFVE